MGVRLPCVPPPASPSRAVRPAIIQNIQFFRTMSVLGPDTLV
jgi:hypothetical protein